MRLPLSLVAALAVAGCAGRTAPDVGAEAGAGVCSASPVTFTLHAPPGYADQYCVGAPSACSTEWLTVVAPDGTPLALDAPCVASCSDCQPVGCPASCALPNPLGEQGVQRTWSGAYHAASTCNGMACAAPACAAPGHYTAKMCVYARDGAGPIPLACNPVAEPTCATLGFDWPPPDGGAAAVEGHVGVVPDGGLACCPSGWSLYGCTYPDGGAGQACHNPQLGCASSTVCGEGCDMLVEGACGG